jgi:hypothetical protein
MDSSARSSESADCSLMQENLDWCTMVRQCQRQPLGYESGTLHETQEGQEERGPASGKAFDPCALLNLRSYLCDDAVEVT